MLSSLLSYPFRYILLCALAIVAALNAGYILYSNDNFTWISNFTGKIYKTESNRLITQKLFNPPKEIPKSNLTKLEELFHIFNSSKTISEMEKGKLKLFELLSQIVQNQLAEQQNQNCSDLNVVCGHQDICGLGCQIHMRVACLVVTYAMGVPLIHDENGGWPYKDKWSSAFLRLGSKCNVGPNTYRLDWGNSPHIIVSVQNNENRIELPLGKGIPVAKVLADYVEKIHPYPFVWWVGQFLKFGLKLNPSTIKVVEKAKKSVNFTKPIVGLHIRRTDKVQTSDIYAHSLEDYMIVAEEYYHNQSKPTNETMKARSVFVASDDATILPTLLQMYSPKRWNIIGFKNRTTLTTQEFRMNTLFEMVTDLFLLIESDLVVCGFSSNICRLACEIKNHLTPSDGMDRVVSLDMKYIYQIWKSQFPNSIAKI